MELFIDELKVIVTGLEAKMLGKCASFEIEIAGLEGKIEELNQISRLTIWHGNTVGENINISNTNTQTNDPNTFMNSISNFNNTQINTNQSMNFSSLPTQNSNDSSPADINTHLQINNLTNIHTNTSQIHNTHDTNLMNLQNVCHVQSFYLHKFIL